MTKTKRYIVKDLEQGAYYDFSSKKDGVWFMYNILKVNKVIHCRGNRKGDIEVARGYSLMGTRAQGTETVLGYWQT